MCTARLLAIQQYRDIKNIIFIVYKLTLILLFIWWRQQSRSSCVPAQLLAKYQIWQLPQEWCSSQHHRRPHAKPTGLITDYEVGNSSGRFMYIHNTSSTGHTEGPPSQHCFCIQCLGIQHYWIRRGCFGSSLYWGYLWVLLMSCLLTSKNCWFIPSTQPWTAQQ